MQLRKFTLLAALMAAAIPMTAQWLDYPTPNVPKTKDGKPDLNGPAPRQANGKPDFSGMWGWDAIQPCGSTTIAGTYTLASRLISKIIPRRWLGVTRRSTRWNTVEAIWLIWLR